MEKRVLVSLILAFFAARAGAEQPLAQCAPPKPLGFIPSKEINRGQLGFTEGLVYENGHLIESTGNIGGVSGLNSIDVATGDVKRLADTPDNDFGEGVVHVGHNYMQLTYKTKKIYLYDDQSGKLMKTLDNPVSNEGWGVSKDESQVVISDGSNQLYIVNPNTLQTEQVIKVHDNQNRPIMYLNSLQVVGGIVYANIFWAHYYNIVKIDLKTGCMLGVANMTNLFRRLSQDQQQKVYNDSEAVLNGIAYDDSTQNFYVTGKNWPKIFQGKFVEFGLLQPANAAANVGTIRPAPPAGGVQ